MDHEQFDILLSAYLDGELTADEQVRVEQLLASSAEARQLVEELRALRAGLQALPQHRLEPSFAERVLRRAEAESQQREVHANDSRAGRQPVVVESTQEKQNDIEEPVRENIASRRFWRNPRGIAWAAVAATIAFMITASNPPENRKEVAKAPAEKAANAVRQQKEEASQLRSDAVADARDTPAPNLGAAKDQLSESHDFGDNVVTGNRGLGGAANAPNSTASRPTPTGDSAAVAEKLLLSKEAAGAFGGGKLVDSASASPADVMLVEIQVAPEAAARGEFDRLLAANKIKLDSRFNQTDESQTLKQAQSANELGRREAAAPADSTKNRDANIEGAEARSIRGARTAPLQAEAARQPSRRIDGGLASDDKQGAAPLEFKKNSRDELGAYRVDFLPPDELQKLSQQGRADLIYVEAAPQQIQSTLDDLQRSPLWFAVTESKSAAKASGEGKPAEGLVRGKDISTADARAAGAAGVSVAAGEQNKDSGQSASESETLASSGAKRGRAAKSEEPASEIWLGRAFRLSFADDNGDVAAKPSTAGKVSEVQSESRQEFQQSRGGRLGGQQNGQQRFGGGGMGGAPSGSVSPAASAPPASGPAPQSPTMDFKRDSGSSESVKAADRFRSLGRLEESIPADKASNVETRKVLFVLRLAQPAAGSAVNAAAEPAKPASAATPPVAVPPAK